MKNTIASIAVIFALSAPSMGEDVPADFDFCETVGGIAENIMIARQKGILMSQAVAHVKAGVDEILMDLVMGMVMDAWDRPIWPTDKSKQDAITEFRNDYELACYSTM